MLALTVALAIDPVAVLAVGFWFCPDWACCTAPSVVSVVDPSWHTVLATQAAVTLGLAPLSLALFQQVLPAGERGGHSTGDVAGSAADLAVAGSSTDALLLAAHQLMLWECRACSG